MFTRMRYLFCILCASLACSSCMRAQQPWITIFVHGTQPQRYLPKKINAFYCEYGICKASDITQKRHRAREIVATLSQADAELFPFEHAYIGGWSGELSFGVRKKTAQDYLTQIRKLVTQYQKNYGRIPRVRMITHSHGGNVALNMAHFYDEAQPVEIDELILLGCPVQQATIPYVAHPMFKKVYVLSSPTDMIQVADMQGWQKISPRIGLFVDNPSLPTFKHIFKPIDGSLFSGRMFPAHEKLKQVYVKSGIRGLFHIEWVMLHVIRRLPDILKYAEQSQHDKIPTFDMSKA